MACEALNAVPPPSLSSKLSFLSGLCSHSTPFNLDKLFDPSLFSLSLYAISLTENVISFAPNKSKAAPLGDRRSALFCT